MTKQQMATILRIMQEHYRAENITEKTVMAWYPIFEDYDFEEVQFAVKMLAKERQFTSFPAPASLVQHVEVLRGKKAPSELWEVAHRAIGKASTFTQETFAELPEELQSFFGSINQLREYGMGDIDKIGFVKASFMRELPIIESRIMAKKEAHKLLTASTNNLDQQHAEMLRKLLGGGSS